ncbi:MAG: AAA family ATPase, partial [Thermoleophilaceae bacterium]
MADQLFETEGGARSRTPVPASERPLAVRMRPASFDELVGQEHLLAAGSALRRAVEEGRPHSLILYGPPGTGKTTIARLIAETSQAAIEELSAVEAGRAEVRGVLERAEARRRGSDR